MAALQTAEASLVVAAGTTNPCKLEALTEALATRSQGGTESAAERAGEAYTLVRGKRVQVASASVDSGVSDQPRSMDETLRGATNRAHASLEAEPSAALGFGIESGLFEVADRMFDICCCVAVVRGRAEPCVGWSCAFEIPAGVADLIRSGAASDLTIACNMGGVSTNPELGKAQVRGVCVRVVPGACVVCARACVCARAPPTPARRYRRP